MARKGASMGLSAILLLVIGIFLIMLGIKGVIDYNSAPNELKRAIAGLFGGNKKDVITIVMAIIDIIAGALLILSLFLSRQISLLDKASLVVIIYWAVRTVYNSFVNGITYGRQITFQPDFYSWVLLLCTNVIILLAILSASKNNS